MIAFYDIPAERHGLQNRAMVESLIPDAPNITTMATQTYIFILVIINKEYKYGTDGPGKDNGCQLSRIESILPDGLNRSEEGATYNNTVSNNQFVLIVLIFQQ